MGEELVKDLKYFMQNGINPEIERYSIFYSYYVAFSRLQTDKQKVRFIDGISLFMFFGLEPDFADDDFLLMAWELILPNLEKNYEKIKSGQNNRGVPKTKRKRFENESKTKYPKSVNDKDMDMEMDKDKKRERGKEKGKEENTSLALEDCKGYKEYLSSK